MLIDVVSVTSGLPAGEPISTGETEIFAKFVSPERQDELAIVTFGSSTCPAIPHRFMAVGTAVTKIVLAVSGGEECSADFGPTTTVVTIPEGFTLASDLLIDNQRAVFH
jgi:hypothetical protein